MDWSLVNRGFIKHVVDVNPNAVLPFYLADAWIDFLLDQHYQFQMTNELSSAREFAACVRQILSLNKLEDTEHLELSKFKQYMSLYFNSLIDEKLKRFKAERTQSKRKNVVTLETIFSAERIDSLNAEHSTQVKFLDSVRYFHEGHVYLPRL